MYIRSQIVIYLWFAVSNCFAQGSIIGSIEEANRLISIGDCAGVEAYARSNFQRPLSYTIFGMSQLDCRHDRKTAIQYFKMAARDGDSIAIEMLVQIGENTSEFQRNQRPSPTMIPNDNISQDVEPPPPHEFSRLPQPRQRYAPPQLIIVQPLIQPMYNPAACIQDGGATYCPYYRR